MADVEAMLQRFADAVIAGDFVAARQTFTTARRAEMSAGDLASRLDPRVIHEFLCGIYGQDPDEEEMLPPPVACEIDGFPYRDRPDDVPESVFRGWYACQFQPDEETGYDVSYELGVLVVDDGGAPAIDRFELVEPD